MKILRVIPSMNPAMGGPPEGIRQINMGLANVGIEVEIVCLDNDSAKWLETSNIKIFALGGKSGKYAYSSALRSWLDTNVINYDAIIIHGLWQYHSYAAMKACIGHNIPYYVYTHGMLDPWFKHEYPLKHFKKLIYWRLFENRVLKNAKGVVFTCQEERILARESFPNYKVNEFVTSYGTAGNVYPDNECLADFENKFDDLKGKKIILFMGRIHEKKGCDLLLMAFSNLVKRHKNYHLFFAGPHDSSFGKSLIEQTKELGMETYVTWGGMLQNKLKWGAYLAAEVFCLPSHQENFGIVVAEALSCGTPVLLSDKVNIWREIKDAKAGIINKDTLEGTEKNLNDWVSLSEEIKTDYAENASICFSNNFEITRAAISLKSILTSPMQE